MAPFKWVLNTGGILMYDNISEGQYLIKLLGTAINNSQLDCPQEDFSWNKLFMLASFHSVANTAFYGLQKLSNNSVVPDDIFENFSSIANKYSAIESLQQYEIRQIFQRFEQNQIFCVPLDGHVIKGFYPRPDMRYVSTLNLLINPKDQNRIHVVLNSLGYILISTTSDRINYIKDGNINLSLRTSLVPERPEYRDYFNNMEKRINIRKGLHFVGSLSSEDFYVYTLAHLAHLYAAGGAGIRSVLDIWVLLKRLSLTLDREYIDHQLSQLNLQLFAFYMEEFAKIWFDGKLEDKDDNEIYNHISTHLFENYRSQTFQKYSERMNELSKDNSAGKNQTTTKKTDTNKDNESAQGDNSIAKEKVFLPMREMKEKYPILDKMPFLLPIYWLIRIVSVVILKNTAN